MKEISVTPFTMTHSWEILPALGIETHTCENPACEVAHGYSLTLRWGAWGLDLRVML